MLGQAVSNVEESQPWRDLLGTVIADSQERQRIASEIGVSPITLNRWVSGESKPRAQNLRHLLKALQPEQRQTLINLIPREYDSVTTEVSDNNDPSHKIPSAFYVRVLHDHCSMPQSLHFSSLCDLILLQALKQLDPNRVGMEIKVVQCMHPGRSGKIHSLRERMGRGTDHLDRELEQRTLFLGAESLAGYVVASGHSRLIASREQGQSTFPTQWQHWEESAMAYPIMRANCVAGCLLASYTQPNYFVSTRQNLLQSYAELLSLAFDAADFYDLRQIELRMMPPFEVQQTYITSFRKNVTKVMLKATANNQPPLSLLQAEKQVWSEIEEKLLKLAPSEDDLSH